MKFKGVTKQNNKTKNNKLSQGKGLVTQSGGEGKREKRVIIILGL